jgi:hypothetical protein
LSRAEQVEPWSPVAAITTSMASGVEHKLELQTVRVGEKHGIVVGRIVHCRRIENCRTDLLKHPMQTSAAVGDVTASLSSVLLKSRVGDYALVVQRIDIINRARI